MTTILQSIKAAQSPSLHIARRALFRASVENSSLRPLGCGSFNNSYPDGRQFSSLPTSSCGVAIPLHQQLTSALFSTISPCEDEAKLKDARNRYSSDAISTESSFRYRDNFHDRVSFETLADEYLIRLEQSKKEASDSRSAFINNTQCCNSEHLKPSKPPQQPEHSTIPSSTQQALHAKWLQSEQALADAYSEAIKHASLVPEHYKYTARAETLMYEWMNRVVDSMPSNSICASVKRRVFRGTNYCNYWNKYVDYGSSLSPSVASNEVDETSKPALFRNDAVLEKTLTVRMIRSMMKKMNMDINDLSNRDRYLDEIFNNDDDSDDEDYDEDFKHLQEQAIRTRNANAVQASLPLIHIPPPSTADYLHMLQSYYLSKVSRKERIQKSETLLMNMMELGWNIACYYRPGDDRKKKNDESRIDSILTCFDKISQKNGNGERGDEDAAMWMQWVKGCIPTSKAFTLVLRCHDNIKDDKTLEPIYRLHNMHTSFTNRCQPFNIPGMFPNDPYLLYHSIQKVTNFHDRNVRRLAEDWLRRLQKFVVDSKNRGYFVDRSKDGARELESIEQVGYLGVTDQSFPINGDVAQLAHEDSSPSLSTIYSAPKYIDVTPVYVSVMKHYSRIKHKGVQGLARSVLDRMHRIHDIYTVGWKKTNKNNDVMIPHYPSAIAKIDIPLIAYNILLGLYHDSPKVSDVSKAVSLLEKMVDAGNKQEKNCSGVPPPDERSFQAVVLTQGKMNNGTRAISAAQQLVRLMEEKTNFKHSILVYNALLAVIIKKAHKAYIPLYDKACEFLQNLNEISKQHPEATPNLKTFSLVLAATAASDQIDHEAMLRTANEMFLRLLEAEPTSKSVRFITDKDYHHIMKVTILHMFHKPEEKQERVLELFSDVCRRGLCSASVLALFREFVSDEEYQLTVGKGRLPKEWIDNVPSASKSFHADGTIGKTGERPPPQLTDYEGILNEKLSKKVKLPIYVVFDNSKRGTKETILRQKKHREELLKKEARRLEEVQTMHAHLKERRERELMERRKRNYFYRGEN